MVTGSNMMGASFNGFPNWWNNNSEWVWENQFIWRPRSSYISNSRIWLTKAWYGYRYVYGPAGEDPVKLEQWLTDEEYMWHQLTS